MRTSDREILKGYYWNHDAIRKDMDRLQTVVNNFSKYSAGDFKKISAWFDYHGQCILFHHHGEDQYFFPMMRERKPAFKTQIDEMEHEHQALDEGLAKLKDLFTSLSAGKDGLEASFKEAATNYISLVTNHLNKEEPVVESAVSDIPVPEMLGIEKSYLKTLPRSEMNILMPWMVDVMDEKDKKLFFSRIPFFVKWIYNGSVKPKFNKMVSCI